MTAANQPPDSFDPVSDAISQFECRIVAIVGPTDEIPEQFKEVLATWPATSGHPGLKDYSPPPLLGWLENGEPVYAPRDKSPNWAHPLDAIYD